MSERTVILLSHFKFSALIDFINYCIEEAHIENYEMMQQYGQLIDTASHQNYIDNENLQDSIELTKKLNEARERKKKVQTNTDNLDDIEVLDRLRTCDEEIKKAETELNGNKYSITKQFNDLFDEFLNKSTFSKEKYEEQFHEYSRKMMKIKGEWRSE